jgi:hypothetical protein
MDWREMDETEITLKMVWEWSGNGLGMVWEMTWRLDLINRPGN